MKHKLDRIIHEPRGANMILVRFDPRQVKREADFIGIVSRFTRLRRTGRQFIGLCPFHFERTPSFYIDPRRKLFKCFGRCDARGDIFDFVMRVEHCDFPRAVKIVSAFSFGVATASERRSRERFGRSEGAEGPSTPEGGCPTSQPVRTRRDELIARLDATERRNAAICAANTADAMAFATACEPLRCDGSLLFINKRITGHE
ncbi:MAG TPA: CHC2 zinc finger domain-containing protein [Candidatus Acidoferrales bacterium]|nr:CHC2 zinc finger domain-containing protein [Candidatus Acidoferrales bacterium]